MTSFKNLILRATYIVAWSIITILFLGCSENKKKSIPDIRELITDTISLPFNINENIYFWRLKHIKNSDEIITYIKDSNFTLYKYSIPKNQIIDSIPLRKYKPIFVDYVYQGEDSLIILLNNHQLILFSQGDEKVYDFKGLFLEHVDSFAFPGEKNNTISILDNIITFNIATNRPRHDFTKPNPNEILYNYIVQLRLNADTVKFEGKYNPYDPEVLENGYYEYRHHIIPEPNHLIYFYDFQNKIYKINQLTSDTTQIVLKPSSYEWESAQPINYDSFGNNFYLFNYLDNRHSINNFLFNYYTKQSLFFLKKPKKYYKDDGTMADTNESEFTLFTLDSDMNVVKEISIPPHIINGSKNIFLTKEALYLRIAKEFQNLDKNETLYYRINLD